MGTTMSALAQSPAIPLVWKRPAVAWLVLLIGVLLLYRETAVQMVGVWYRSDTFAHAFLVAPISAWLAWRNRDRLAVTVPAPDRRWLLPLALAALAWFLGDVAEVNAAKQLALVTMIVMSVPTMLGWPVTRALMFPLLFLFFAVPIGEFALPTLMEWTADFTVAALRLTGIPVYREGLQFVIPSGNWSVVEGCSGVRYMMASVMVGSLFAYLNYQSMRKRLLFLGVSILVPLVANWLRAYMIVMLGHLSNNRIATGVDHLVYGWVFFGVVITVMFMIGSRWAEPDRERVTAGAAGAFKGDPMLSTAPWMVALASALVVLGLPQAAGLATQQPATAAAVRLQLPASPQGAWQRTSETPRWAPSILGADVHAQAVYQDKQAVVGVHVYYYRAQSADRKLVSSVNTLVTTEDPYWHTLGSGSREALVDGERVRFTSTQVLDRAAGITKASRQLTVWKTYWVDDQFTPNDVMAKLLGSVGVLSRRGDDGAALVIYTETSPQQTGDDALAAFVQSQWPALREALRQARAAR